VWPVRLLLFFCDCLHMSLVAPLTLCRYYKIASAQCRRSEGVAMSLSPSYDATVPLPYFSWPEHPLDLPFSSAAHTAYDGPEDKIPGKLPPPQRAGTDPAAPAVWIASNCVADNWRRQLVVYLRRYVDIDSIGKCDTTAACGRFVTVVLWHL
jgi:hypothetical protein